VFLKTAKIEWSYAAFPSAKLYTAICQIGSSIGTKNLVNYSPVAPKYGPIKVKFALRCAKFHDNPWNEIAICGTAAAGNKV